MYLNTHSYYSLRYGTFSPQKLLEQAKENGVKSFAITDINNTSACLAIVREAHKYGIKPIVGIDFRNGIEQVFVAIAKNNSGFQEMNEYLTPFLVNKTLIENGIKEIPAKAPDFKEVTVIYPYKKGVHYQLKKHEYLGIKTSDLDYIRIKKVDCSKAVILQTVTFTNKRDFNAHRLLRAIDKNTLLSKLPESEQANPEDKMLPIDELLELYQVFPAVIQNTQNIIDESSIFFDLSDTALPHTQKYYTGCPKNDKPLLLDLCEQGLYFRYPTMSQ